jgi:hypothetical protein
MLCLIGTKHAGRYDLQQRKCVQGMWHCSLCCDHATAAYLMRAALSALASAVSLEAEVQLDLQEVGTELLDHSSQPYTTCWCGVGVA